MILVHTYPIPVIMPHIRILETPLHFSGPSPLFKNLEKFARDFIQPKLGSYLIFVERWYEPVAQATR